MREAATICPRPYKLTFDLLTLKVVSESRATWATYVPILVFLGLSLISEMTYNMLMGTLNSTHSLTPRPLCSRLRHDVRDRQTDVR